MAMAWAPPSLNRRETPASCAACMIVASARGQTAMISRTPATRVQVNLERAELVLPDGETVQFPIPPFSKYCLLNGIDEMGFLLKTADDVATYESTRPSTFSTLDAAVAA